MNPIEERSQSNKTMNENLLNAFATHAKDNDTNFEMIFEKLAQLSKWKESFESSYQEDLKTKLANTVSKQDLLKFSEDQAKLLELTFKPYEEQMVKLGERIDKKSDSNINNPDYISTEISDLKEKLNELDNNNNEIQELKEITNNINTSIETMMQEMETLKDECRRLDNENTELRAELVKLPSSPKEHVEGKDIKEDLEGLKETIEDDISKLRTTVAEIEGKVDESSTGYQDISLKLNVANSKLAAIEKKVNSLDKPDEGLKQIQIDVDELKASSEKFNEADEMLNALNERIEELEAQITDTQKSKAEPQDQLFSQLEKFRTEINKNGETIKEDIEELKEEQAKIMSKMNEEEPVLDELVDKLKALEGKVEELKLTQNKKIEELELELEKTKENSANNHKTVIGSIGILKTDVDGIKQTNANIMSSKDEPVLEKGRKEQAEDLKDHALEEMNENICTVQTKVKELEEKVNNNIDTDIEDIKADIEKLKKDSQDYAKSRDLSPEILAINNKIETIEQKFSNSNTEEMELIRLLQSDIDQLKNSPHPIVSEDKEYLIDNPDSLLIEATHNKPESAANIPEDTKAKKSPAKIPTNEKSPVKPITEKVDAPIPYTSNVESPSKPSPREHRFEEDKAEQEIKKGQGNYKDDEDELLPAQGIHPLEDKELSNSKNKNIRDEEINLIPEVASSEPVNDFDIFDVAFPAVVNSKEEKKDDMIEKALAQGLVDDLIDMDSDDIKPLTDAVHEDFGAPGEGTSTENIEPIGVQPIEDTKGENPNKKNKVDGDIEDNIEDLLKERNLAKENSDAESLENRGSKIGFNPSNDNDSNEKEDSENEKGDPLENFADALLDDAASQDNQSENEGNSGERAVFVQSLSDVQFEGREEENEFKDLLKQKTMTEVGDIDFLDQLPDAEDIQGSREDLGSEAKQEASNDFLEDLASYEPEEEQVDAQELSDAEGN